MLFQVDLSLVRTPEELLKQVFPTNDGVKYGVVL